MTDIPLLLSHPFECDYIPDRTAQYGYVGIDEKQLTIRTYSTLARHGFRRSGDHIYRPFCEDCKGCLSIRVDVNQFQPSRSQRRCWKKNQSLTVTSEPAQLRDEDFRLFQKYQEGRHSDSSMANMTSAEFEDFLCCEWANTRFFHFRDQTQRLIAVAVCDILEDGLSAVYTFFDPKLGHSGLGNFAIQWEIAKTQDLGLRWLYLGYWIKECGKMSYKSGYQPYQFFHPENGWQWNEA